MEDERNKKAQLVVHNQGLTISGDREKVEGLAVDLERNQANVFQLDAKIKANQNLIIVQKKSIEEIKWELEKLKSEREVQIVKTSTQELLLSKLRKELDAATLDVERLSEEQKQSHLKLHELTLEMKLNDERKSKKLQEKNQHTVAIKSNKESSERIKQNLEAIQGEIVQIDRDICELTSEIREQNEQIEELSHKLSSNKEEHEKRNNEKKQLEKAWETLKSNFSYLTREKDNLDTKLNILNSEIKSLETDILEKEQRNRELEKNITVQNKLLATRESRLKEQQLSFESLSNRINELEGHKERNLLRLRDLDANLNELKSHSDNLQGKINSLRDDVQSNDQTFSAMVIEKSRLETENEALSAEQQELETKVARIKNSITLLNSQINSLRDQYNGFVKNKDSQAAELDRSQKVLNAKDSVRNDYELKIKTLASELVHIESAIAKTQSQIEKTESINKQLSEELQRSERNEAERKGLLEQQESHIAELDRDRKELEDRLNLQESKSKRQFELIQERQTLISSHENDLTVTRSRLSALKEKINHDEGFMAGLDAELNNLICTMLQTEQDFKTIDKATYLAATQLSGNIPVQAQYLSDLKERVRVIEQELNSRMDKIAKMDQEQKTITETIDLKNKESEILYTNIEKNNERIKILEETLHNFRHQLIETQDRTNQLKVSLNNKFNEESELSAKVESLSSTLSSGMEELNQLEVEVFNQNSKNSELRVTFEELKSREEGMRKHLHKKTMQYRDLETDNGQLEQMISEYQEKVQMLDQEAIVRNNDIEQLTFKNRELINKINNLEILLQTHRKDSGKNASIKVSQDVEKNQQKLSMLETLVSADKINQELDEYLLDTNDRSLKSVKNRLEMKHFGLTLEISGEYTLPALEVIENSIEKISCAIEDNLGDNVESFCLVNFADKKLKINFGITQIPNSTQVNQFKQFLGPALNGLAADYSDYSPAIKFRMKVGKDTHPEKVMLEMDFLLSEKTQSRDA